MQKYSATCTHTKIYAHRHTHRDHMNVHIHAHERGWEGGRDVHATHTKRERHSLRITPGQSTASLVDK